MPKFIDGAATALTRVLDLTSQRHGIVATNIANRDTPGYRAQDIDFRSALADAIESDTTDRVTISRTHAGHIGRGGATGAPSAEVVERPQVGFRPDGNSVDLDREMAALNENTLTYTAAVQLLTKKIALMRYAVSDGGGG